jgi:hypothetical protein
MFIIIICDFMIQLPLQSVPITTQVASSNPNWNSVESGVKHHKPSQGCPVFSNVNVHISRWKRDTSLLVWNL